MKKKKEKTKSVGVTRWRFSDLAAFIALALSAILLLVGPILTWILKNTGSMRVMSIISMVAQFCLLFALAIPAWYYVRGKRRGWRVFYYVVLVIYVAGAICGLAVGM